MSSQPVARSTVEAHLALVEQHAKTLADALREASDAGVSHALILPRLVLVFREALGEMPQGSTIPGS